MKTIQELIEQLTEIAEGLGLEYMTLIWDGDKPVSFSLTDSPEIATLLADAVMDEFPEFDCDYLSRSDQETH